MGGRDTKAAFYRGIVEYLVDRRKGLGLTQVELARRMSTDQSQISKFERTERRLDLVDYVRYCNAIEIDAGKLLSKMIERTLK